MAKEKLTCMSGFIKKTGKTKFMYFPKTASTAMLNKDMVILTTGQIALAVAASTNIVGVLRKTIATTDADYADTTDVPVEVPVELNVEWEFEADSGLTAAMVGLTRDLIDENTVDGDDNSQADQIVVTRRLSATKGWGIINQLFSVRGS